MKIPELKRSGIRKIVEFREIPAGFLNQVVNHAQLQKQSKETFHRVVAVNVNNPKNNYNVLGIGKDEEKVFEDSHNELIKFVNIGTGIGRGFSNTQEL
jgi:hypothetical protein